MKNSNRYFLMHGYTGAIDIVQEKVAKFLKRGEGYNCSDGSQISQETIDLLKERGYLTYLSPTEEKNVVKKIAENIFKLNKIKNSFLFLVTYDCNFRCPYCFENEISGSGKAWSKKVVAKELVDKAYEVMLQIQPDRNRHQNNITLYGGEPLLLDNYEIVSYIVNKGIDSGYVFNAITNGYDLNYYDELLKPGKIETVQITIDGIPEVHDKRRIHSQAKNTFYNILKNVEQILRNGIKVIVRVNIDSSNINVLSKLSDLFCQRGLDKLPNFKIYSALVRGNNEAIACNAVMTRKAKEVFEISKNHLAKNATYENISRKDYTNECYDLMGQNDYVITCQDLGLKVKIKQLINSKKMAFQTEFCGAQTGMYIFDPYGDLYTCWEVVGMDEQKVGRYDNGLEIAENEILKWQGRNITTVEACSKCKYAFFCGGGCEAHALFEGKGHRASFCDSFPKVFQKVLSESYDDFSFKND